MFISRYRSFRPLGVFFLTLKLQTVFILLIDVWSHSGDWEGSILDFRQRDLCGIPTGKHWYHLLIWRHQYQFLYVPYRIWRKYIWSQHLYGIGLSGFKTQLVQYFLPNFWLTTTTTAYPAGTIRWINVEMKFRTTSRRYFNYISTLFQCQMPAG